MVCVYFFFLFDLKLIQEYYLDLFLISFVLLLDLIVGIAKIVSFIKFGVPRDNESSQIAPEDNSDERQDK